MKRQRHPHLRRRRAHHGRRRASGADKKKAVESGTKLVLNGLMSSTVKKLEALFLHGGQGLGQLEMCSDVVAGTYEAVSGFHVDVRVSNDTFAEAIWMAFEGNTFDLFGNTSGVPAGSKLNTATNTLLNGVNQTGFVLESIAPSTLLAGATGTDTSRVLRLWHSSGTAGVAGTGVIGGWTTVAAGSQWLVFESAGPGTEFSGGLGDGGRAQASRRRGGRAQASRRRARR